MKSFLARVHAQYQITAASGVIKTTEPIKIEWQFSDDLLAITVDGIDYAVIDPVTSMEEIDLNKVKNWVEETYYDEDYKSDAYTACRMKPNEFRKK